MASDKKGVDVSRRDFGALLGAFGGAAGIGLVGCAKEAAASQELTGAAGGSLSTDSSPAPEFARPLEALIIGEPGAVTAVDCAGLLPTGAILFVESLRSYFMLDRASTLSPDGRYVIAPAGGGGNWVRMPQGDNSGDIVIPTGQALFKVQGGTPSEGAVETLWRMQSQPQPDGTPNSVYATVLDGGVENGVFNPLMFIGYNPSTIFSTTEPQVGIAMEANFNPGPGSDHLTEFHIVHGLSQSLGQVATRVFTSSMNRRLGSAGVGLEFNAPIPGEFTGSCTVDNVATGARYLQLTGGVQDYFALGHAPASSGSLRLSSAANSSFDRGIAWKANLGAWDYQIWTNAEDELIFGAASTGTQGGFTNIVFNTRTTSQGGSSIVPNVDLDVGLGTAAKRWKLIRGGTVAAGELDLFDEAVGAQWTLREETDCILAVNRVTDQWYKVPLIPLTDEERARYGARPLSTATSDDAAKNPPAAPAPTAPATPAASTAPAPAPAAASAQGSGS